MDNLDLVFLSLPNGKAQEMIKRTFNKYKNIKFIDLSLTLELKIVSHIKIIKSNTKQKNLLKSHFILLASLLKN